jgi:hypothetical protein
MRSHWKVTCVAALLIAAACSDGKGSVAADNASPETTAPSSTTTLPPAPSTTSPPPAPLSAPEAAERYLAIVEPYNVALEALEQAANSGQPVETLRAQAAAVAAANATHIEQLRTTMWPTNVQPAVDQLVSEAELAQNFWVQASQAQTRETLIAAVVSAGEHDGAAAAGTVRSLLGLGDYNEDDYS